MAERICSVEGCGKRVLARGWCNMHYSRWRATGEVGPAEAKYLYRSGTRPCSIEGCDRYVRGGSRYMCKLHYERFRLTGDPGPAKPKIAAKGSGNWYFHQGYLRRSEYVDGKLTRSVLQHVEVMEQELGRRLVDGENVHHKNGIRHDNDPDNLELWLKMQPSGQRVTDLMEYIAKYHADAMRQLLDGGQ